MPRDIEAEARVWRRMFGEEAAAQLQGEVEVFELLQSLEVPEGLEGSEGEGD